MLLRRATVAIAGVCLVAALPALAGSGSASAKVPPKPSSPEEIRGTWIGTIALNGPIFREGEQIVFTANGRTGECFGRTPCVSKISVIGIGGCKGTGAQVVCKERARRGSVNAWAKISADFANPTGTSAGWNAFYYVIPKSDVPIQGNVTRSGKPVRGTTVKIKGKAGSVFARTDASGFYAATVKPGTYVVSSPIKGACVAGSTPCKASVQVKAQGSRRVDFVFKGPSEPLIVNATTDAPDEEPGDGVCDTGRDPAKHECTLRAALQEAEGRASAETISFKVGGPISVESDLPASTYPVSIRGSSVVVDLHGHTGFRLGGAKSTLEGMTLSDFKLAVLVSAEAGRVAGNRFLTSPDRVAVLVDVNGEAEKPVDVVNNTFSDVAGGVETRTGLTTVRRNRFTGSIAIPISVRGEVSPLIENNVIDADVFDAGIETRSGSIIRGNTLRLRTHVKVSSVRHAIFADSGATVIGNRVTLEGSFEAAIRVDGDFPPSEIENNVVKGGGRGIVVSCGAKITGNDVSGIKAVGGSPPAGIYLVGKGRRCEDPSPTLRRTMITKNRVHDNASPGVLIAGGYRIELDGNSIHSNSGIPIDLRGDGITKNVSSDDLPRSGVNHLPNYPVINSATRKSGTLTIAGFLTGIPNETYRIEFFVNEGCGPGNTLRDTKTSVRHYVVTPNATGAARFSVPIARAPSGGGVTATATDVERHETSEVSACARVE